MEPASEISRNACSQCGDLRASTRRISWTSQKGLRRGGMAPGEDLNNPIQGYASYFDVVVAAEVIEHLENPRCMVRDLFRLCRPGGSVIVTTPNNESLRAVISPGGSRALRGLQRLLLSGPHHRSAAEGPLSYFAGSRVQSAAFPVYAKGSGPRPHTVYLARGLGRVSSRYQF